MLLSVAEIVSGSTYNLTLITLIIISDLSTIVIVFFATVTGRKTILPHEPPLAWALEVEASDCEIG